MERDEGKGDHGLEEIGHGIRVGVCIGYEIEMR